MGSRGDGRQAPWQRGDPAPSHPHEGRDDQWGALLSFPQVLIRPVSKVVIKFLRVMQKHGYIGEFEFVDDHRAGKVNSPPTPPTPRRGTGPRGLRRRRSAHLPPFFTLFSLLAHRICGGFPPIR